LTISQIPALEPYGLSAVHLDQLPPGTEPARVIRHDGTTLLGMTGAGSLVVRNSTRLDPQPTVGDWLAIHLPTGSAEARIDRVLPRTSLLRRQSADETGAQALAANVDLVLITCGVDRPIRAGRIQRIAAQAWDAGATPALVLTKAGGSSSFELDLPRLELEHPGLQVLVTSALEGIGLAEIRDLLAARTAVLLGESGAGKSTLTNVLLGREAAATGAVRPGDAKGRHTTTSRQLHLLPGPSGGVLIDTPGLRSVGLLAEADAVDATFAEIPDLANNCRFGDCAHLTEPGCAVLAALESGELARERYESWRRLQREVASAAMRSSPHELRRYGKQFSRMAKEAAVRKRS
jgi:ribosome biogenesis GTPase